VISNDISVSHPAPTAWSFAADTTGHVYHNFSTWTQPTFCLLFTGRRRKATSVRTVFQEKGSELLVRKDTNGRRMRTWVCALVAFLRARGLVQIDGYFNHHSCHGSCSMYVHIGLSLWLWDALPAPVAPCSLSIDAWLHSRNLISRVKNAGSQLCILERWVPTPAGCSRNATAKTKDNQCCSRTILGYQARRIRRGTIMLTGSDQMIKISPKQLTSRVSHLLSAGRMVPEESVEAPDPASEVWFSRCLSASAVGLSWLGLVSTSKAVVSRRSSNQPPFSQLPGW